MIRSPKAAVAIGAVGLLAPLVAMAAPAAASGGPYITEVQVHEIQPSQIAPDGGFPVQVDGKVPYGQACQVAVQKYSTRTGTWTDLGTHTAYDPDLYYTDYVPAADLGYGVEYSMMGYDCDGNSGNTQYSAFFYPRSQDQRDGNFSGSGATVYASSAFRGSYLKTPNVVGSNAYFYSSSVLNLGVYAVTGPWGGKANVYVDGAKKATVSFYSAKTKYRQLIFKYGTSSSAYHTVRFQASGRGAGGKASMGFDAASELAGG